MRGGKKKGGKNEGWRAEEAEGLESRREREMGGEGDEREEPKGGLPSCCWPLNGASPETCGGQCGDVECGLGEALDQDLKVEARGEG